MGTKVGSRSGDPGISVASWFGKVGKGATMGDILELGGGLEPVLPGVDPTTSSLGPASVLEAEHKI